MGVLLVTDADLLSLDCPAVAMRLEDVMKAKSPQVLVWHCQLCQREQSNKHVFNFLSGDARTRAEGGDRGGGRRPHQVGFGVGRCLVDLPETEEALPISNATLQEEYEGISTVTLNIQNTHISCICVCVRV